jgi:hypothetical protein
MASQARGLDLPRRYGTIIVCGALGLGTTLPQDTEALRRLHERLLPGGTLALDFETPWTDAETWAKWTPEERRELPVPWGSDETQRPDGRWAFLLRAQTSSPSDWSPTVDHFPVLKKDGGQLVLENVRLAHRRCNRDDYADLRRAEEAAVLIENDALDIDGDQSSDVDL